MSADDLNIQNVDLDGAKKANLNQAAENQDQKKQEADTSLATTVMLLKPALENMAQVYNDGKNSDSTSSVQSPKDLFASSPVAKTDDAVTASTPTDAATAGAGLTADAPSSSSSSSSSSTSGTDPSSSTSGTSDTGSSSSASSSSLPSGSGLTSMTAWKDALKQILSEISHMPAGEALAVIMTKLLPFLGSFTQWQMSQEGVTMNLITELNNDWSKLKDEFTQYGEGGADSSGNWPSYEDAAKKYGWTQSPAQLIADMDKIITGNKSLSSALGSSFLTQLKAVTGSSNPLDASNDSIMTSWANDWKKYNPGTSGEPSSNIPTQTVIDAFTSFTTSLNNQSSEQQGQFKQTSSDLNTYDQILAGVLKDTTQMLTYFNQHMTGN